jgi:hypothetical protein
MREMDVCCNHRLWLDDTYSVYGGELHLKDWFNNPTILLRGGLVDALIRHFITGTSQNFDYNVAEAVKSTLAFYWTYLANYLNQRLPGSSIFVQITLPKLGLGLNFGKPLASP